MHFGMPHISRDAVAPGGTRSDHRRIASAVQSGCPRIDRETFARRGQPAAARKCRGMETLRGRERRGALAERYGRGALSGRRCPVSRRRADPQGHRTTVCAPTVQLPEGGSHRAKGVNSEEAGPAEAAVVVSRRLRVRYPTRPWACARTQLVRHTPSHWRHRFQCVSLGG